MISMILIVAILLIAFSRSGNAVNLLLSMQYSGQTTCNGTTNAITYEEVNICETGGGNSSFMYTCEGFLGFHNRICEGPGTLLSLAGNGCQNGTTSAQETLCVDADWYRAKTSTATDACDASTSLVDTNPVYAIANGTCSLLGFAGFVKIGTVASDNTTVLSSYGIDHTCSTTPIDKTVTIGVCFNDPKFGRQVVLEKVQNAIRPTSTPTTSPTSSPTRPTRPNGGNSLKGHVSVLAGVMGALYWLLI